jgi:hypothetical protein
MNEGQDNKGDSFEPELPVRWSPTFAREQRRKGLFAGLLGLSMAIVSLADAFHAMRTGRMVDMGPYSGHVLFPPWLVALMGLFLLVGSGLVLWKSVVRRS